MLLDVYQIAAIDDCWNGSEHPIDKELNAVEVMLNSDGAIVFRRVDTPEFVLFTPEEWEEIVEFVRERRIDEGWEEAKIVEVGENAESNT